MKTYVFYSGATRKTGESLCEVLKATGGDKAPEEKVDLVIGWGCKTNEDIKLKTKHSLNHPNNIRANRNKLNSLKLMKEQDVPVANFMEITDKAGKNIEAELNKDNGILQFPLIGRTNFHQGGQGFWLCLTLSQMKNAISEGAQYFQNYVPLKTEYRLHVFKDEVFYAHKKVKHEDPKQAFIEDYVEKARAFATQNNQNFDEETAKVVLARLSERRTNPNPVLRSHMEGWKFTSVKDKELGTGDVKNLCEVAKNSIKALKLSFAAVDCAIGEDGQSYVIEVNTGPGLTGKTFDKWVEKLQKYITTLEKGKNPEKEAPKKAQAQVDEEPKKNQAKGNKKESAMERVEYLKTLINKAENDEEVDTIMKVASRTLDAEDEAGAKFFGG